MTEKRFKHIGCDIFQYGEWWCSANGEHCADVIATAMNELLEENEQLKKENKLLLCTIVEILDFIEDKKEVSVEEMGRWWKEKEKELVE